MTNTAWVLNFAGWRSQKDIDKSASLESPAYTSALKQQRAAPCTQTASPASLASPPPLLFWNPPAPTSLFGCRDCSLSGWAPWAAPPPARPGAAPAGHPARAPGEPRPCPCKEQLPGPGRAGRARLRPGAPGSAAAPSAHPAAASARTARPEQLPEQQQRSRAPSAHHWQQDKGKWSYEVPV